MNNHPPSTIHHLRERSTSSKWCLVGLLLTAAALLPACSYYSFTGATIPEGIETIAIPPVLDNTTRNPFSELDTELTDLLLDRFVSRTRLQLETNESQADAVLEVRLVAYENEPTAVGGDERAALNRVSLRAAVRYVRDAEDGTEEELLDRTFNSSAQYDPVTDGREGAREAALAALDDIADDIFSQATSNW